MMMMMMMITALSYTQGEMTSQKLWSRYVRHFVGITCRAYSKRVPRPNCALRIKKCAPRISSGIYF